jgi:hypothetical protein
MRSLLENVRVFYRYDCCWPYAASFYLTLVIYYLDFFVTGTRCHWASPVAYGILLAYYLYNVRRYFQGRVLAKNARFLLSFLSFKIAVWGSVLCALYGIR